MTELHFKGKEFVRNHHLSVPHRPLVPDVQKSVGEARLDGNLIIHGDNLHALKSLLPIYAGRVNCIYIDPPYNTGNENWCYNDNVNSPQMQQWLSQNPVGLEDGLRHDKWCCMMWPRLVLLRELLAEDGVIFISIDDNEQHRLRLMMDEIFGAQNAIANIIWEKRYAPTNDAKYFSSNHDFVICYVKTHLRNSANGWGRNLLPRTEKQNKPYKYDDQDGKGRWRSDNLSVKSYSAAYDYPIVNPVTKQEHLPPVTCCWRTSREKMQQWMDEGRIYWGAEGTGAPQLKRYLNEVQPGIVPMTIWTHEKVGHTDGARKMLKEVFADAAEVFDNPKPLGLLDRILQVGADKNAIILDSFAGSGTAAHAVLSANQQDNGNRRFILVECEDYADTVTAQRVRNAIKGVPKAKDVFLKHGLGGSFTYCTLGDALELDKLLTGEKLPSFEALGALLFHTATNQVIEPKKIDTKTGYLGATASYHVWLIYEPNLDFLKSDRAALTLDRAEKIAQLKQGSKRHLVFAPATFVSKKRLDEANFGQGVRVDYQPLPWALYRVAGS